MSKTEKELRSEKWFDKHTDKWEFYPHLTLLPNKLRKGWVCKYCGHFIPFGKPDKDGMVSCDDGIGCTERPKPCKWCGESPLCAPDCVGMRMALSDDKLYVIGDTPYDKDSNND